MATGTAFFRLWGTSPNSNAILARAHHAEGNWQSIILDLVTGDVVVLADGTLPESSAAIRHNDHNAVWSPDGTRIAYLARDDDQDSDSLWLTDMQGVSRRKVLDGDFLSLGGWSGDRVIVLHQDLERASIIAMPRQ